MPYPVYFVCHLPKESENLLRKVIHEGASSTAEDLIDQLYEVLRLWSPDHRAGIGTDILNWPIQTYVQLMKRGLNVELVSRYVPGQICVAAYEQISPKKLAFNSFVVACQYDRGRPELCNHRIVQNQLNVIDVNTDHFVPHWPQPNLICRDHNRGNRLETLAYKGRFRNLADSFKQSDFIKALEQLGTTLIADKNTKTDLKQVWVNWHDYSQVDVVLAVRNNNPFLLKFKPASKLINAWLAGCPALLGPEPAYQQLRKSDLDYIEVQSPEDAISALKRLKSEPGYYQAIVENGWQRMREYDADGVAKFWRDVLAGPITEGYKSWQKQSLLGKVIGRPIWYAQQAQYHKQQRFLFNTNREVNSLSTNQE
ncbi:MAG: glycosyltransferase [Cyanobacteria bacterium J06635_10]